MYDSQARSATDRRLIDTKTAAGLLGVSQGALRQWRYRRQNLPYHRIAGRVRYDLTDVLAYRERRRVEIGSGE